MRNPPFRNTILPLHMAVVLALILAGTVVIAGCTSQQPAPVSGNPIGLTTNVKTGEILKNPAAFNGTTVIVQGKITSECGSGCWFMLDDGTGVLYTDLAPNNFAIPQMQGSVVTVTGTIGIRNGDPVLLATNVATGSGSWP